MARTSVIGGGKGFVIEDVGGSFERFKRDAPKIARQYVYDAVERTAFGLQQRMKAMAPVGPDAPHIRDRVTYKRRGATAQVGFIDATEPAAPGSDASIADVALYNEYDPNKQPFMLPAAQLESRDFLKRMTDALQRVDRDLSGGGGLL